MTGSLSSRNLQRARCFALCSSLILGWVIVACCSSVSAQEKTAASQSPDNTTAQAKSEKNDSPKAATKAAPSKPAAQTTAERISRATKNINQSALYDLKYKFKKGEQIRKTVTHIETTRTRKANHTDTQKARSENIVLWSVTSVDSLGNMTFKNTIESTNCWMRNDDLPPIKYNSLTDKTPPLEYEATAERVGAPISTVTVSPRGKVLDKKQTFRQPDFGVGKIVTPLPDKPIPVGFKWYVPSTLSAKNEAGYTVRLKTRVRFELSRVVDNKAHIAFRTQVLTPIHSQQVKSQIMQKKNNGYLSFDMDLGRIVFKQVTWDDKVQGFAGPDSFTEYIAKHTEKLEREKSTHINETQARMIENSVIKPRGAKPLTRF